MTESEIVTEGSGNVFEDLGFDRPLEEQAKASLVREIRTIIDNRDLTQTQAGKLSSGQATLRAPATSSKVPSPRFA